MLCLLNANMYANSGFVKLLFGVEPSVVVEGKNKSAVVLTQGYLGYNAFNYIQQTDSLGNIQWLTNLFPIQDTSVKLGVDMNVLSNSSVLVITHHKTINNGLSQHVSIIKDGVITSTATITNTDTLQPLPLRTFAVTEDSCFIQVLQNKTTNQFYIQKVNSAAQIIWTKILNKNNFNANLDTTTFYNTQYQLRIKKMLNNAFAISGIGLNRNTSKYEWFQAIYDNGSQNIQYQHFALPEVIINNNNKPILFEEAYLNANTTRIAVMNYDSTMALNSYYISDLNSTTATKNIVYTFQDSSKLLHFPQRLYIDNNGSLFFLKPNSIFKKNANGTTMWNRILFPDRVISIGVEQQDFVFMQSFTELSDSTFYIIGRGGKGFGNNFCLCVGVLVKANKNGVVYERLIKGKVFIDDDKNCAYNNEIGLKQLLVEASNATSSFYAVTDTIGNYTIPVDAGSYTVTVYLNNTTYWQACTPSIQVNTLTDTTKADFAIQKQVECPLLNVDIAIPFLRRCFDNTYQIHFCNEGTTTAQNAYIKVMLDSSLQVNASSIPWTSVDGNTYTFSLGNIDAQQCGDFSITANLDCNGAELGETHCVQASIFPDSLCVPANPNWDGAIIKVSGKCIGDSVQLQIQNTGSGNMQQPRKYYVLEGDFLRTAPQNFQLTANEIKYITIPADGNTVTLTAQQSDGFPFPGNAIISIESCNGDLQPGYVNHISQNNSSPFIAVNCTQNIGSFDPNFKSTLPVGVDSFHYITNTTPLEYIVHFQNTGTDTAFSVTVTDTLSKLLTISSVKMGASSHKYNYTIANNGILKVQFDNIRLPDSSENYIASQSFFKFSILPKNNLADNVIINNDASIFFDFNNGVETNNVYHTIKENIFNIVTSVATAFQNKYTVKVYPNPFSNVFTIKLITVNQKNQSQELSIFDVHGNIVFTAVFNDEISINTKNWNENMYLYTISINNNIIASGKLLKQ
jgi:hypothetical protein